MPGANELERMFQEGASPASKIWSCKIGEIDLDKLPLGSDGPMRKAVAAAYKEITGEDPVFIFSGWGAELNEGERAVVENRMPDPKRVIEDVRNGR